MAPSLASLSAPSSALTRSAVERRRFSSFGSSKRRSALSRTSWNRMGIKINNDVTCLTKKSSVTWFKRHLVQSKAEDFFFYLLECAKALLTFRSTGCGHFFFFYTIFLFILPTLKLIYWLKIIIIISVLTFSFKKALH